MSQAASSGFSTPERLNIVVFIIALPTTWIFLWGASHTSWPWPFVFALGFSHLHMTLFALLHEAVHGIFSRSPKRNDFFGRLSAMTFPTSFTLQRIAHLGHHRRNRTNEDLYDYVLPTQSKSRRNLWLYAGNLLGFYYWCLPLGVVIYFLTPGLFTSSWFQRGPAHLLGFEEHVTEIAKEPWGLIWRECFGAVAFYGVLIWFLDLGWGRTLLCFHAFALHWSALQYVDHAWSPRDIMNGAWNLRISRPAQALALNYHLHLAHHQYPQAPWVHLPRLIDPETPRPSFWRIYFSLWRGTRPAPPMGAGAGKF